MKSENKKSGFSLKISLSAKQKTATLTNIFDNSNNLHFQENNYFLTKYISILTLEIKQFSNNANYIRIKCNLKVKNREQHFNFYKHLSKEMVCYKEIHIVFFTPAAQLVILYFKKGRSFV